MGVTVEFRFPAGRYHATPWDRHVNEGEVEWPPSPWRLLRTLLATWHRKVSPGAPPQAEMESLLRKLAAVHPRYRLPPATRFHTRHYMPTGKLSRGEEESTLIFDAFVRVEQDEALVVQWPGIELSADERDLLDTLLQRTGYLGRAESWVVANLTDEWRGAFNCLPAVDRAAAQSSAAAETLRLAAPLPESAYVAWRTHTVERLGLDRPRLSQRNRRLLATIPPGIVDALQLETSAVQEAHWSRPPGMEFVPYKRPQDALTAKPVAARPRGVRMRRRVHSVRLLLVGKPLPRLTDAVRIGEAMKAAAVGQARRQSPDGHVSWVLSGRGIPSDRSHAHAYFLPEDAGEKGRIDHVLVHAQEGLTPDIVDALGSVRRIRFPHRPDDEGWAVLLQGWGAEPDETGSLYAGAAKTWRTATPYLRPWHSKRNFGLREQLQRECRLMGLPPVEDVVELEALTLRGRGRRLRPIHFHRFRAKAGLPQPDTRGSFVEIRFARPVRGPLALGFGSHFGLGMFRPVRDVP